VIVLGALIAFLVNRFLKMAALQWVDRLLGGIFGLLRGWAIASIIALALIAFPVRQDPMTRSVFAPYLLAGARRSYPLRDGSGFYYRALRGDPELGGQDKKEGRLMGVVSRGGAILVEWMEYNKRENPLYEYYDRLLERGTGPLHVCGSWLLERRLAQKKFRVRPARDVMKT
jgi:hypothetical protein